MRRALASVTATLLAIAGVTGCASKGSSGSDEAGDTTLTVFAASSLTSTFEELGNRFEQSHDGVTVRFSFAGSSDLVAQIQQGAPADVFASADTANMDKLVADDLVRGKPVDFASNSLEIAVPPGNPANVHSLQDLTKPGLNLVVCAPEVPCGAASREVAQDADLQLDPVSEEQSVTDVLNKVASGEADAGLVYVTDILAAGDDVEGVEFPESSSVVNTYPIAVVADSHDPALAQEWVALVQSPAGQSILQDAGFGKP